MTDRRQESYSIRLEAAELARSRTHPDHKANGDEQQFAGDRYFMSFTKGLPHNPLTGLLHDPAHFVEYRRAIDDGFIDPFSHRVPHGAQYEVDEDTFEPICHAEPPADFRQWEAPTAGTAYELQGPDAQSVTMPPAPALLDADGNPNPELIFEMAEVYELALLRDQPFTAFENGQSNDAVDASCARLNALAYGADPKGRPRKRERVGEEMKLTAQTLFRGSSPGVEVGPYLSQFMVIGNGDHNGAGSVADGRIGYGVLHVDQRVPVALEHCDFMQDMASYVNAQRGLKPTREEYEPDAAHGGRTKRRFITTPRDLATYVHYDALYEAYLNACTILLGMGTPFDPSFDHLSGVGAAAGNGRTRRNAAGFALYGGPHILTLVTEVATRALKAVRFQKFNNHIRLRPEALAARIELERCYPGLAAAAQATVPPALLKHMAKYHQALDGNGGDGDSTLAAIHKLHHCQTYFLPMAFPEGSPMHPAYGAGHATVAGACVTILKAFFDTSSVLVKTNTAKDGAPPKYAVRFKRYDPTKDQGVIFRVSDGGAKLTPECPETDDIVPVEVPLTLEGELNKLAANISIGRNMAGVHYFSDYYDSLRMGEQIAIGVLEEQALTYPTDPFVLSLPGFDGDTHRIGRR